MPFKALPFPNFLENNLELGRIQRERDTLSFLPDGFGVRGRKLGLFSGLTGSITSFKY